ncbi:MAG: hypothetical protein FWG02_05180 [Holophagaceae bacterium]|nr:hypothetical protein [Holophagaceae bacterium]
MGILYNSGITSSVETLGHPWIQKSPFPIKSGVSNVQSYPEMLSFGFDGEVSTSTEELS